MAQLPRIIVERSPHGHWDAWFDGRPQETWSGDSPGTAVDRLWAAMLNDPRGTRCDSDDLPG